MTPNRTYFDYSVTDYDIRPEMPEAYREAWNIIAAPGNWWCGEERVAIAAEVRAARDCELCRQRKAALSPFTVSGTHKGSTRLPEVAVDAVHRLATDASRLTESWLTECQDKGLAVEQYVELLGIVVSVVCIDGFHRAMGIELEDLPEPEPGDPSKIRPASAVEGDAWVPRIPPTMASGDEADLYNGNPRAANVLTAMSLVPDSVRLLKLLSGVQYLEMKDVVNPSKNGNREISRAQMELLAGRVSALNDCFY